MESFKNHPSFKKLNRNQKRKFERWEIQQRKKLPEFQKQAFVKVKTTIVATILVIAIITLFSLIIAKELF